MNAQEALKNFFIAKKMFEDEVYNSMEVIEDFIDKSNAKPKTLEELGWIFTNKQDVELCYERQLYEDGLETELQNVDIGKNEVFIRQFDEDMELTTVVLSKDDLLAIAEKMKELGMTNE